MRIDHWPKQIFMFAGLLLAWMMVNINNFEIFYIFLGFLSASLCASANYVINEWFDKDYDIHHPLKKNRPAVDGKIKFVEVMALYIILLILSLFLASKINTPFLITIIIFFISGITYNIEPLRTKDIIYIDVISEAVNNPLRLMLGWFLYTSNYLPPTSLIIIFWLGGAFLMSMKRFAEFRLIKNMDGKYALNKYRKSFRHYTSEKLLLFSFLTSLMVSFFVATFIIKYKSEYLLLFPFISILLTYYLYLSLQKNSIVQTPEKLFKNLGLNLILLISLIVFIILSLYDFPITRNLIDSEILSIEIFFKK